MSWGAPWWLLALILPLLGAMGIVRLMRAAPRLRWHAIKRVAIAGQRLRPAQSRPRRPAFITLLAITLALIAVAKPRWGEQNQESYTHTREVMIALDLSRSMLTEDVDPSRLEQARTVTESLLDALKGERVGLIVFAGTAFVQVPLSSDYQIIREFLPLLDPDYLPQGGSDYTGMLNAALEGFGEDEDADRYLIVLSDGESTTEGWNKLLDKLTERQIHVLSMGVGTEEGGFIPDEYGGYLQDADGGTVHSTLMPATLQTLARRTNGRYLNASTLADVEPLLADTVETGRKGLFGGEVSGTQKERFQWLLLPAVLLGMLGLVREFRQRPQPRQIRLRGVDAKAAASRLSASVAVLACLLSMTAPPAARAHFDAEAGFDVREEFDSNPVDRLRAIVRHLGEFDYDAYDLRLMVEATIKYGLDEQRTGLLPAEGVIRDAIEATRRGEQLDPSIADWGLYRSRLTAMLAPPESEQAEAEADEKRKELMDEEDNPPVVTGQSTQQSATDSFGQGASTKTDAALGDLSPGEDPIISRGKKPPLPKSVRKAAAMRSKPGGGSGSSVDPILEFSKKRMKDVTSKDSPGRLHQLLSDGAQEQRDTNQNDW